MVILLVEDEPHVQFFIWKLLKAEGFTVLTAGNGEAAQKICREHHGHIDLLLTDFEIPGMNGLELSRIVKAERPDIKAVVMSGALKAREQSQMAGLPFLQKPFQPSAMRQIIGEVLGSTTLVD